MRTNIHYMSYMAHVCINYEPHSYYDFVFYGLIIGLGVP